MEKKDLHGNKIRFITNSLKEAILGGTIVKILKTFKKGIISSSFYDSTIFASVLIKKQIFEKKNITPKFGPQNQKPFRFFAVSQFKRTAPINLKCFQNNLT